MSLRSPLSEHDLRQRAYREAATILCGADVVTEDLSLDEDNEVERIIRKELTRVLDNARVNENDDKARERLAKRGAST